MRDRDYTVAKPAGTFRIALLGSSIDMGWGVGDDETYENLLEDWLNDHARRRGIDRRFEVLNFAVAAYGPLQRYALLGRKAEAFAPDLVLYSSTTLDARLLEIHLTGLLMREVDPTYAFLKRAIARRRDHRRGPAHHRRGQGRRDRPPVRPQGRGEAQGPRELLADPRRDARRAGRGLPLE